MPVIAPSPAHACTRVWAPHIVVPVRLRGRDAAGHAAPIVPPATATAPAGTFAQSPSTQRQRWAATGACVAGGLGLTVTSAIAAARTLPPVALCGAAPLALSVAAAASLWASRRAPADAPAQQRAGWAGYHILQGASLAPLAALTTPWLLQAGALAVAAAACLIGVGALAPAGTFARWERPLTACLLGLCVASFAQLVLPASAALTSARSAWAAANLAVAAGLMLVEGARLRRAAQMDPHFDPVAAATPLTVGTIYPYLVGTVGAAPLAPIGPV